MSISDNISRVQERIRAACERSGREPAEVTLVAVSKTFPAESIRAAYEAGLRDFGENRVQEAEEKAPALADLDITWRLIGRLQSNKVRRAAELFQWVDSVDSEPLATKLDRALAGRGVRLRVMLEVNLGGEETKGGFREDSLPGAAETIGKLPWLDVQGLMVIPPWKENPADARPYFRRLRELSERVKRKAGLEMRHLSMGMSHDFEVAIEEGATMIRLGTAIFGER
ncbi:MAG: YggS family pyridoxal phosphate-dependent enzyme [Acidobacteriota bacterium]|nr:YggS family pyridoxal phosphate-dependent enzyme [Acidobacteriota bacterium]